MTNRNDDDVDLGLSLGSTNHCVRTTLNNSSGAGVNANSGVDIAFAASDPLSELVWSPHKGLSLKCADPNLADKNPFVTWNVGPSKKVFSQSQSVRSGGTEDEKAIDKGNSTILPAKIDMDKVVDGTTVAITPRNSPGPLCNASHGHQEDTESCDEVREGVGNHNDENIRDNGEKLSCPEIVQNPEIFESSKNIPGHCILTNETSDYIANMDIASSKLNAKVEDGAGSSQIFGISDFMASESHAVKNSDGLLSPLPNLRHPKVQDNEVTSAPGEENKMKMHHSTGMHPLVKLESSDENDLYHLTTKQASSSSDERFPRDKYLPLKSAPKNSMIFLNQRKSKEKAFSDGDDNGKLSNCEDSQESVESCNSVGFFPRGKRRHNYEKDFSGGRKKMKNQIQGSSGSTSMIRHGNSFMNWISGLVKCIPNSSQGQAPPLVLPLAHPNEIHKKSDPGILISKKENDSPSQPMGFQTIFRSLYYPRITIPDTSVSKESHCLEESKELVVADNTFLGNPPITCHTDTDNSCKKILASNTEVNPSQSRNLAGQHRQPWNFTAVKACGQDACKRNSAGNKPSRSPACSRENARMSLSDSLHKLVNKTADNTSPSFPLEGKVIGNMSNESSSIPSLWITHFSTRTPRLENCNPATDKDFEHSTVCTRVSPLTKVNADFPNAQKSPKARVNSPEDQVDFGAKEMQSSATSSKASLELKSISKFDPILLSQCKSSEVMASVFAQRLDALKHITPSNFKCSSTFPSATCFICGGRGHDVHDSPDFTETELDDLVRSASSFYRVQKSPPLCLGCFQLDHWAVTCPMRSTSWHHQSELNASFANHDTVGCKQLCAGKEKCSSSLGVKEDHPPVFIDQRACRDGNVNMHSFPSNLLWNISESSGKRTSPNEGQNNNTSNSEESDLKRICDLPFCASVSMKNADALIEMFDVVQKLRISRVDVLRWMNSNVSLSPLNGFFLRLRLGKWGASLGGTGYYVACITESTGAQRQKLGKGSKNSVFVDILGIQSFVGSEYVSNHEFLEEEIRAWWCRIVESGGRIPSLDELKSKFEERMNLGV